VLKKSPQNQLPIHGNVGDMVIVLVLSTCLFILFSWNETVISFSLLSSYLSQWYEWWFTI